MSLKDEIQKDIRVDINQYGVFDDCYQYSELLWDTYIPRNITQEILDKLADDGYQKKWFRQIIIIMLKIKKYERVAHYQDDLLRYELYRTELIELLKYYAKKMSTL